MGRWVSAARRLQRCETRTPCGLAERHVEADVLTSCSIRPIVSCNTKFLNRDHARKRRNLLTAFVR